MVLALFQEWASISPVEASRSVVECLLHDEGCIWLHREKDGSMSLLAADKDLETWIISYEMFLGLLRDGQIIFDHENSSKEIAVYVAPLYRKKAQCIQAMEWLSA